ncbi:hypothetical protein Phum_PHUM446230 [Pediculus humanus corporis]|uniref:Uncharacterized protein n=1 Tax=Pediculus humanus subsp. corporis TaxID=121224 RepID=E0VU55_PEDHC|nr:uncharacterized protein Phum_PHUM446230 [Pediculus humanus corporis]EEB16911.1 hypothetical protein Phum_PHUM446230 [Pediculus humanus corporis]
MIGVPAFCCFPIDISVRLIGTLTNALVFIALVSNSNQVLKDDKIRIIFGFDTLISVNSIFIKGNKISGNASAQFIYLIKKFSYFFSQWFSTYCFLFTLASAISSALLIGGSITAQRWLTVPWLFCSIFNVFCHFTSLLMLSFLRSPYISEWVTAFSVLYSSNNNNYYFSLLI